MSVEALAALYEESYLHFVRVAEGITGDPDEARDAVQEGFANALRGLSGYRGDGSFEGWVWRCVMNAARMSRRRALRKPLPPEPIAEQAMPSEPAERWLLAQIAELPERQRLALFLRYFADLSYMDISEILEVSPGTVAASLHAAHRVLRQRIGGL